ncbi:MAG: class II glutamine amidotransferase [Phycisphaerales bacterium]|nr:class II glutamine amidotransferase [Phycisphaerales bacterium]
MCRWLAYIGSPIFMDTLLVRPEHSLINQSINAQRSVYATNGDGFGIGWFDGRPEPGIFRDTTPAWHDLNLRALSQQICTKLFFAHVRAATSSPIQRTNCHPFKHGRWLFQHNGSIGEFEKIKRDLDFSIDPEFYPFMLGCTDSETMFYLALTHGLEDDPVRGLHGMAKAVCDARNKAGVKEPFRMTVSVSDGQRIIAVRFCADGEAPTLYHSRSEKALHEVCGDLKNASSDGMLILSEPLDDISEHWEPIETGSVLVAHHGNVTTNIFDPV